MSYNAVEPHMHLKWNQTLPSKWQLSIIRQLFFYRGAPGWTNFSLIYPLSKTSRPLNKEIFLHAPAGNQTKLVVPEVHPEEIHM